LKGGKKGQSAIELIITYSWAFIIIGIFVAFVFVLAGAKAPSQYLPSQCSIQPLLPCPQTLLSAPVSGSSNSLFRVLIINNLGASIQFAQNQFVVTTTNYGLTGVTNHTGSCSPKFAFKGDEIVCVAQIPGSTLPGVGSQVSTAFTIEYQICNGNSASTCPSAVYRSTGYSIQSLAGGNQGYYNLSLSSSPSSIIDINGNRYTSGTSVFLPIGNYIVLANPPTNYVFNTWALAGNVVLSHSSSTSSALINITVSGNATITANYIV
jgi:hypothetical protein